MDLNRDFTEMTDFVIKKASENDMVIALGGNPNVGKSTVFNELTGLKQHTGNWPGKTVINAQGFYTYNNNGYVLVDLPGSYSLMAHSAEEEIARDFICFGGANATVIVCDATCPERSMNLVLQTLEITPNVVVCFNLMDEAEKKKIKINLTAVSEKLGVPVIGTAARSGSGLDELMKTIEKITKSPLRQSSKTTKVEYPEYIENAINQIEPFIKEKVYSVRNISINNRWLSLMLLHSLKKDGSISGFISDKLKNEMLSDENILKILKDTAVILSDNETKIKDDIVSSVIHKADNICRDTVTYNNKDYKNKDAKIDRVLTGKLTAFPIMLLALTGIFWLTITGANYPSELISNFLFWIEDWLIVFFKHIHVPEIIYEALVLGVYRVLAWVVSVMLPPMAIFFPLFTLLEDVGFLPRISFNLDKCFKKCCTCGKQALTM